MSLINSFVAQGINNIHRQIAGARVTRVETEEHRTKLKELREMGKLGEYSDKELLTSTLNLIWTKPK